MKYLSDYIEKEQTELFNQTGTFFAFDKKQFDEAKVEGVKYVNMGNGMITNKLHVKTLIEGLEEIYKKGIAQDLAENGKKGVIKRELYNHEAFYTWSIQSTFDALEDYGITREEVREVFNELAKTQD